MFDTRFFSNYLHFNQLVKKNTRGMNILDKIFTNCAEFYGEASILPPLGRSDHSCVLITSSGPQRAPVGYKLVSHRVFKDATYDFIASDLININWRILYRTDDIQAQADLFYAALTETIERHAPVQQCRFKNNDKPWITAAFKNLVFTRNEAFNTGDEALYRKLRNSVNRSRKALHSVYYNDRVCQLKKENNKMWWKEMKSLCQLKNDNKNCFENVCFNGESVNYGQLPDVINNFLVSVSDAVPALSPDILNVARSNLDALPLEYLVSEYEAYRVLCKLKVGKASLSDNITNKLLRVLADVLAAPLCALINTSLRQGKVPEQWRIARISPIPKTFPVRNVETDVRPIAVTCPMSKVADYFISTFFDEHFSDLLDVNQFGSTKARSTTLALIKFSHILFDAADESTNIIRVLFIDFKRAFELIDHNILHDKLKQNAFPQHILT